MKKYLAYLLIALLGLPIFTPAFAVTSSSVTSSASYKVTVQNIVKKYVQNLDDANYTDTEIITRLETLRAEYTKQKSLSSYRGSRKMKINMIIDAITDMIKEVDNRDTTSDDDLYSIFNQTPTRTTTTTTSYNPPSCTKEAKMCTNGSYVYRSGNSCEFTACPVVSAPVPQMNNIT